VSGPPPVLTSMATLTHLCHNAIQRQRMSVDVFFFCGPERVRSIAPTETQRPSGQQRLNGSHDAQRDRGAGHLVGWHLHARATTEARASTRTQRAPRENERNERATDACNRPKAHQENKGHPHARSSGTRQNEARTRKTNAARMLRHTSPRMLAYFARTEDATSTLHKLIHHTRPECCAESRLLLYA
jgi:hypothetical protein